MKPHSDFDAGELYPRLAPRLRHLLGVHVDAPPWVLEDACQVAWTRLLADAPALEAGQVLGWLATTARREALLMLRRSTIELRIIDGGPIGATAELDEPEEAAELSERLGQIRRLSRRQQRVVWMRGMGFAYREIAADTGQSVRTVERQLASARRRLNSAA